MKKTITGRALLTAASLFAIALPAHAQTQAEQQRSLPQAVPISPSVPDPVDTPWPGGTIDLAVDATDITRGVFRTTETIPLAPGTERLTLLYPEWLPGKHAPRGFLAELTGIRFTANGQDLKWTRDPVEVYAFHVEVPAGTEQVAAQLVYTSPLEPNEGRIVMTPEMMNLKFEDVSLYPAGHYVRRIAIRPTVTFPEGWDVATALDGMSRAGDTVQWATTDYQTLVDSPIFAGAYHRAWDLGQNVDLEVFADAPRYLEASEEQIDAHRRLVDEAIALYGSKPFDHYEFLLGLTDKLGGIGLEHHRSSENTLPPDTFTEWKKTEYRRGLLPHEMTHSWNGKFRRPARLWTPDYRQPMQDNLLWVYEGMTSYWDMVLAARSGLQTTDLIKGDIARTVANYMTQPGRAWRSVEDTTHDPIFAARKAKPFSSQSRGEEYYSEGALTWLEADMLIRRETGGRKSLEDFNKRFFGLRDGDWGEVTYEFEDVVADLNAVHPYDWANFLGRRLQLPNQPAPTRGVELAGYRVAFRPEPNPYDEAIMANAKYLNLWHSLGLNVGNDGSVSSVLWDGPAFKAGIVGGADIVAVNGEAYDSDAMKRAIAAAADGGGPIELLIERGGRYLTVPLAYDGGLRYPWLEPVDGKDGEQLLDRLLEPTVAD